MGMGVGGGGGVGRGDLMRDVERRVLVLKEAGLMKQGQGRVLAVVWVQCVGTRLPTRVSGSHLWL